MDEYAEDELEKANDALSDARKLRDVNGTDEAIINRLYYACFHAAQSVLHTRGFDSSSSSDSRRRTDQTIVFPTTLASSLTFEILMSSVLYIWRGCHRPG